MWTGLDRLGISPDLRDQLASRKVGLLAHAASVDRRLRPIRRVLAEHGIEPRIVFGPEHGFAADAQDMVAVSHGSERGGPRIVSLYGDAFEDLSPKPEDLAGIETLIIDMQDVGSRYYTFVWTALLALRVCARLGIDVCVLDRPNPLGTRLIEGRVQEPAFRSFVGLEPLPIRHGLTLGEILAWRAEIERLSGLSVVTCRDVPADPREWDRPFVMPSPNMPTMDTALVYPGGCLLEGTNLSEGRGTTRPFEIFGAPWLDADELARQAEGLAMQGVVVRPLSFRPMFHKHAGQTCGGVQVHVIDREAFRPVYTYAALIALAHHMHPKAFAFRTERYEFIDTIPAFDLLTGSAATRLAIERGESPRDIARDLSTCGEGPISIALHARKALAQYAK